MLSLRPPDPTAGQELRRAHRSMTVGEDVAAALDRPLAHPRRRHHLFVAVAAWLFAALPACPLLRARSIDGPPSWLWPDAPADGEVAAGELPGGRPTGPSPDAVALTAC